MILKLLHVISWLNYKNGKLVFKTVIIFIPWHIDYKYNTCIYRYNYVYLSNIYSCLLLHVGPLISF